MVTARRVLAVKPVLHGALVCVRDCDHAFYGGVGLSVFAMQRIRNVLREYNAVRVAFFWKVSSVSRPRISVLFCRRHALHLAI